MEHKTNKNSRAALATTFTVSALVIALLGLIRVLTNGEFAFASFAIIPVFVVTWVCGRGAGIAIALMAVAMWVTADVQSDRTFSESWIPYANGATRLVTYGLVVYLTTRIRALLKRESEMATSVALTGLLNRRAFHEAGAQEAARAARYSRGMAVVFIDLDNFKQLNDTRGHHTGDLALQAAGTALTQVIRSIDSAARVGGDEFAALLLEIDQAGANAAGQKLRIRINDALAGFPGVSASIGLAWFAQSDGNFEAMVEAADATMYEVKRSGKGRYELRAFARSLPAKEFRTAAPLPRQSLEV